MYQNRSDEVEYDSHRCVWTEGLRDEKHASWAILSGLFATGIPLLSAVDAHLVPPGLDGAHCLLECYRCHGDVENGPPHRKRNDNNDCHYDKQHTDSNKHALNGHGGTSFPAQPVPIPSVRRLSI